MKIKISLIILVLLFGMVEVFSQTIDDVLSQVMKNNKELQAARQLFQAQQVGYKTGLAPEDPRIEYGKTWGNQLEVRKFGLSQKIDFPTVYLHKKKAAALKSQQSEFEVLRKKTDILHETRLLCIELIFLQKRQKELRRRLENAQNLFESAKRKSESGEASILEFNKAKLSFLKQQNENRFLTFQYEDAKKRLTKLNGGNPIAFSQSEYPLFAGKNDTVEVVQAYLQKNPKILFYQAETKVLDAEYRSLKAQCLPDFEFGYALEKKQGENVNGVRFGMSIPLWKNTKKLKFKQQQQLYNEKFTESSLENEKSFIRRQIEKVNALEKNYQQLRESLQSSDNAELLNKAYAGGQISAIEYYLELAYFYDIIDEYLRTEYEFNIAVASLYKFDF